MIFLKESDEYLRNDLVNENENEIERVSISKLEYDSIVAAERQLQHQLEMLQSDRDHLALQCQAFKDQINQLNNRFVLLTHKFISNYF